MRLLIYVCLLWVFFPHEAFAQGQVQAPDRPIAPISRTYLIQNAKIVQAPGRVLEKGSVLIENGIITQVGASISAPYDALIVKGDSLTVYAGFVDGFSHIGVPKPKEEPLPRIPYPNDPTYERAGVQPYRNVRDFLKPDDTSVEEWRKLGFTAAQVAPYGQMMAGQTALILLGGETTGKMVFMPEFGQAGQLLPATRGQGQGVYPSNVLGIMAMWRQAFGASKRNMTHETAYQKTPVGMNRPEPDAVLSALYPLIRKEKAMTFYATDYLNVLRGIKLSEELGYKVTLAGLKDGFEVVEVLKSKALPVFLSLNLPEEPRGAKDSTKAAAATARIEKAGDVGAELARLRVSQQASRKQYLSQAASFQKAGIPFGFSTKDAKSGNLRKTFQWMLEAGLKEDELLAALTTSPAKLLGVDALLGSVDKGKVANLVLTDGPVFNEKTNIRMVFVDGVQYKYAAPKPAPKGGDKASGGGSAAEAAVLGTWTFSVETPGGQQSGTIELNNAGGKLAGIIRTTGEENALENLKFENNTLSFSVTVQGAAAEFLLKVKDERFEGTIGLTGMNMSLTITGSRTTKPN